MNEEDFTSFYKNLAEAYTLPPERAKAALEIILNYLIEKKIIKKEEQDELL